MRPFDGEKLQLCFVGKGWQTGPLHKELKEPPEVTRAKAFFPMLDEYALPTLGSRSECNTLFNSLNDRKIFKIDECKLKECVEQAVSDGPMANKPPWLDENVEFEDLCEAIASNVVMLNEVAGPGYPWCRFKATKNETLDNYGHYVFMAVMEKFHLLGNFDFTGITDPILMHKLMLVNPLRVFIKNEAHKKKKLRSPGARVIVNPSIDDELLSKITSCTIKEKLMENWGIEQSSCLGMGRTKEDTQRIIGIVHHALVYGKDGSGLELATNDCSGFEHSIQKEINDAETELTIKRMNLDTNSFGARLIRNINHLERSALYILSDGKVVAKNRNHGTASGGDRTSVGNTNKRDLLCRYVVGVNSWSRENGDDNIEEYTENAVEKYASIGITIKDYVKIDLTTGFEFCSAVYKNGKMKPINLVKSFYHLLRKGRTETEVRIFLEDYKDHEKYEECVQTLRAIGWIA